MGEVRVVGISHTNQYVAMQVWDQRNTVEVRWYPALKTTEIIEIIEEAPHE